MPAPHRVLPAAASSGAELSAAAAVDPAAATARFDLRLAPPAAAAWASAWVALAASPRWSLGAAVAGAFAGLGLLVRSRGPAARIAAAALLVAAAAASGAALRVASLQSGPLPGLARDTATVDAVAVVTGDPQLRTPVGSGPVRREPVVVLRVRLQRVHTRGRTIRVRAPAVVLAPSTDSWRELTPGQTVLVSGRLAPSLDRSEVATLRARGSPRLQGRPNGLERAMQSLRIGLRRACAGLSPGPRGLVPGLVVGDTSGLAPELVDDFRAAGLTHLTAVSGANVAILIGALLLVLRRLGVRGRWLPGAATLALAGFVVLARPQPSVLRAAAMGLVALAALASGRRQRGMPSLGAAVTVLVLLDPWQARSYGFALSVVATTALLVLAPPIAAALTSRGLPLRLAQALAVPLAATATTAPITVMLSSSVSFVAVPANLLAEPAVAPATVLGLVAAVVAPVSPWLASATAHLAGLPAAWIVGVATRAAALPHATLAWPSGWSGAIELAGLLLLGVLAVPRLLRRRWSRRLLVGAVIGAVGASCVHPPGMASWPPAGWVMVVCDVGQGDALVLNAGVLGAVVVDAGPDPASVDRCLRTLGVTRVALLLLTHLHADHVEGIPGVVHGRAVAQVEIGPLDEPPDEARRVAAWTRAAHLDVVRARFGEERSVGPLRWQVLAPQPGAPDTGPNDASVVILVHVGDITMLLTGDVEPPAQKRLLPLVAGRQVDVLKVPHHGSAHQEPDFLAGLRPRLALISVGKGNTYGHPAATTIALLRDVGALVARTDEDGDLAVVGTASSLRLVRHRR